MQGLLVCGVAVANSVDVARDHAAELVDVMRYEDVQTRVGQDPELTLVVAISGGGYRAANFALGALLGMEQLEYVQMGEDGGGRENESNLLNEVDYFSTVSGGGLAVGLAIMSRLQAKRTPGFGGAKECSGEGQRLLEEWVNEPGVAESLRDNHTFRLVASKFALDVAFTRKTSGDALQMRLDESILLRERSGGECGPKEAGKPYVLGDILPPWNGGSIVPTTPYWFMNATDLATGSVVSRVVPPRVSRFICDG